MRLTKQFLAVFSLALSAACSAGAPMSDEAEIAGMLKTFLAGVDTREAHDRFWADDLIYTSSAGTRTDKSSIMAGFDAPADEADGAEQAGPSYGSENVVIKVHGDFAVIAFELVANMPASGETQAVTMRYLNTGTFLKRAGVWQVIAWQATKKALATAP